MRLGASLHLRVCTGKRWKRLIDNQSSNLYLRKTTSTNDECEDLLMPELSYSGQTTAESNVGSSEPDLVTISGSYRFWRKTVCFSILMSEFRSLCEECTRTSDTLVLAKLLRDFKRRNPEKSA